MADRNQAYQSNWSTFRRLSQTQDSAVLERRGFRRWLLLPYIAFVIPIEEPGVVTQLLAWQSALQNLMAYEPQPAERLHITVHFVGLLRRNPFLFLPNMWSRERLPVLAERARAALAEMCQFDLKLGPLNAFPNVLFVEVQDEHECLRTLRAKIRRAMPLRARPPLTWSYVPHVTLGLWGQQPIRPIVTAMQPYRHVPPVTLRVERVKLTLYVRDVSPAEPDILSSAREEIVTELALPPRPANTAC